MCGNTSDVKAKKYYPIGIIPHDLTTCNIKIY